MIALFSLPLVVVLVLIVGCKLSSVRAGLVGTALAVALAILLDPLDFNALIAYQALINALILTLMAMAVIFSGLLFNDVLSKGQFSARLQNYILHLPMPLSIKAFLLIFGLLPALEALTGFGVSLLLSVPLLMTVFNKQTGLRLSMLGMNIIPWGTMGLATLVGAELIGVEASVLGIETAYLVAGVMVGFSLIAILVLGIFLKEKQVESIGKSAFVGVLAAGCCGGLLMVFNHLGLTETAGVLAGGTVFVSGFLLCGVRYGFHRLGSPLLLIKNLSPYLLVVGLVLVIKLLVATFAPNSTALTITGFGVTFNILKSPAIALSLAAGLVWLWLKNRQTPISVDFPIHKTLKSCSGLFVFVLLAQLLNFAGFLQGIVGILNGLENPLLIKALSPLLAIGSGFITGSNTSANALLINMQNDLGALMGDGVLFAAIQNAGSGLAIFSSMPIIILMMTIAKGAREDITNADEANMLKFGLKCLIAVYIALLIGVWS